MLVALMLSALGIGADGSLFMPENDLYLEDVYDKSVAGEDVFNKMIDIADRLYQPVAQQNNERLVFNRYWSDSTVNASMMRSGGVVTVNMYGGLYRRPEITPESFAMVICHELGHAYGGMPYLRPATKISAEGQSDYYSAKVCIHKVMAEVPESEENAAVVLPYADTVCTEEMGECPRALRGALGLGQLLGKLSNTTVSYETPDRTVVTRTELSYPKTAQCRLDTSRAGILGQERPLCWYKPTSLVW
jgi:hypothetical protein